MDLKLISLFFSKFDSILYAFKLLLVIGVTFLAPLSFANTTEKPEIVRPLLHQTQETKLSDEKLENALSKINELQALIQTQNQSIKKLNEQIIEVQKKNSGGMSFEVWTGILLACAALLLTIVGVGIALISIFGYQKIVGLSSDAAEKIAREVATQTSADTMHHAITKELIKLIDERKLEPMIKDAVEAFSYRGLTSLADVVENDQV